MHGPMLVSKRNCEPSQSENSFGDLGIVGPCNSSGRSTVRSPNPLENRLVTNDGTGSRALPAFDQRRYISS